MTIKELREQFAALHTAATTFANDTAEKTAEQQAEQDARFASMDKLTAQIEQAEKLAAYKFSRDEVQKPSQGADAVKFAASQVAEKLTAEKLDKAEFAKAVNDWARTGQMAEQFATITTATQSNVFLPREIASPVIPTAANSFRDGISAQGMDSISIVTTPTTVAMKIPVITGVAGGLVAETAGAETDGTPTLTESFDLNVGTYQSGSVYYSNQVLAAGGVDVNSIVPTLQYEKELGLESAIVAAMIADAGITTTTTLAAATAASVTYAKLQAWHRALPKRFDNKKIILVSDDCYNAMESMVDSQNRPILTPDAQNSDLKRFLGTPVIRCSYLEAIAAAKTIGLCISLVGFRLRDVSGANLAKYDQVPTKPNQVGFNLFAYHAYGYSTAAVAKLKTP